MGNGILVKPSDRIKGYNFPAYPSNVRSKEFMEEIKNIDKRVKNDIYYAAKKMIDNKKLRARLGKNGRRMAETKFSIKTRNKKLKKVFDEAIIN